MWDNKRLRSLNPSKTNEIPDPWFRLHGRLWPTPLRRGPCPWKLLLIRIF